jgi:hypothetical protein
LSNADATTRTILNTPLVGPESLISCCKSSLYVLCEYGVFQCAGRHTEDVDAPSREMLVVGNQVYHNDQIYDSTPVSMQLAQIGCVTLRAINSANNMSLPCWWWFLVSEQLIIRPTLMM